MQLTLHDHLPMLLHSIIIMQLASYCPFARIAKSPPPLGTGLLCLFFTYYAQNFH